MFATNVISKPRNAAELAPKDSVWHMEPMITSTMTGCPIKDLNSHWRLKARANASSPHDQLSLYGELDQDWICKQNKSSANFAAQHWKIHLRPSSSILYISSMWMLGRKCLRGSARLVIDRNGPRHNSPFPQALTPNNTMWN